jgi:hypothetical protein
MGPLYHLSSRVSGNRENVSIQHYFCRTAYFRDDVSGTFEARGDFWSSVDGFACFLKYHPFSTLSDTKDWIATKKFDTYSVLFLCVER